MKETPSVRHATLKRSILVGVVVAALCPVTTARAAEKDDKEAMR